MNAATDGLRKRQPVVQVMRVNWRSRFFVAMLLLAALAGFASLDTPWLWNAATLLFAAAAAREWGRLCGLHDSDNNLYIGAFVAFTLLTLWWKNDWSVQQIYFGAIALFWIVIAPWWTLKKWRINQVLSAALGLLILHAVWSAVSLLYQHDLSMLLVGLCLVWVFDSASYFVGRAFGKTPLAPGISPKKTIEGLLGGISAIIIGGAVYYHYFIPPQTTLVVVVATAFALGMLALLGDMFLSLLKRLAGVKDSGGSLGEHGGVLDRVDSLLPVLPVVALLSPWIE